jgi:hypothetical protein
MLLHMQQQPNQFLGAMVSLYANSINFLLNSALQEPVAC